MKCMHTKIMLILSCLVTAASLLASEQTQKTHTAQSLTADLRKALKQRYDGKKWLFCCAVKEARGAFEFLGHSSALAAAVGVGLGTKMAPALLGCAALPNFIVPAAVFAGVSVEMMLTFARSRFTFCATLPLAKKDDSWIIDKLFCLFKHYILHAPEACLFPCALRARHVYKKCAYAARAPLPDIEQGGPDMLRDVQKEINERPPCTCGSPRCLGYHIDQTALALLEQSPIIPADITAHLDSYATWYDIVHEKNSQLFTRQGPKRSGDLLFDFVNQSRILAERERTLAKEERKKQNVPRACCNWRALRLSCIASNYNPFAAFGGRTSAAAAPLKVEIDKLDDRRQKAIESLRTTTADQRASLKVAFGAHPLLSYPVDPADARACREAIALIDQADRTRR